MIGTTADLKEDMLINLQDLLYGMMLPSGNDAAFQTAQIGAALIQIQKEYGKIQKSIVYSYQNLTSYYLNLQNSINIYLIEMNRVSRKIGLKNSNWANPHGLSNTNNVSTAQDVAVLCMYAMRNA